MLTTKKLSLAALLAVGAAAPASAFADHGRGYGHGRDARDAAWIQIGDVGTHAHDAEDYVPVAPGTRLDRLELAARDGTVAIDGVQVQFADCHSEFVDVHRRLFPGQAMAIDLPDCGQSIQMLVLDYGNQGPYWRARETAHLQVLGQMADLRGRFDDRDSMRNRGRIYRDYRDYQVQAPNRFQLRGGVQLQIR